MTVRKRFTFARYHTNTDIVLTTIVGLCEQTVLLCNVRSTSIAHLQELTLDQLEVFSQCGTYMTWRHMFTLFRSP